MPRARKHGSNAGRPEMGGYITAPLGADRKDAVAEFAVAAGIPQAEAVRQLIDAGLAAGTAPPATPAEVFADLLGNFDGGGMDLYETVDGEETEFVAGIETTDPDIAAGVAAVYLTGWRGAWLVRIHHDPEQDEYLAVRGSRLNGIQLWQDTLRRLTTAHWVPGGAAMWSDAERTDQHLPADLPAGCYE